MALLSNPDTPLRAIRDALEKEPAITAGLLRVVNSAAYRARSSIDSVEQAVQRLGSRHVLEIVTSVAAMGMFKDAKGVGLQVRDHCARSRHDASASFHGLARCNTPGTKSIF